MKKILKLLNTSYKYNHIFLIKHIKFLFKIIVNIKKKLLIMITCSLIKLSNIILKIYKKKINSQLLIM